MTSLKRDRSLVVIELQGGNDALNTVVPYNNGLYYDFRPAVGIPQEEVIQVSGEFGLNPSMSPMKHLWDGGKMAVINGIGYPSPNRSHFRSRGRMVHRGAGQDRRGGLAGRDHPRP